MVSTARIWPADSMFFKMALISCFSISRNRLQMTPDSIPSGQLTICRILRCILEWFLLCNVLIPNNFIGDTPTAWTVAKSAAWIASSWDMPAIFAVARQFAKVTRISFESNATTRAGVFWDSNSFNRTTTAWRSLML